MINKDINDGIFKKEAHEQFYQDVDTLRCLIKAPINKLKDRIGHLKEIEKYFSRMYPFYTLGVFLPGAWREDFIKRHGKQAKKVLELVTESRKYSEGLLKECDLYIRQWVSSKLTKMDLPEKYAKVLSVKETREFINKNQLPTREILDDRTKGYAYISGRIHALDDFEKFLKERDLKIKSNEVLGEEGVFKGIVACAGARKGSIIGAVQTVFHVNEVSFFKKGSILVSNMTAPEYLPAVKKAKAIITDEGGLSCHAAIISRELGIPCVVGTKIATKVLKDGDKVEVDAKRGIVRKLKK